MNNVKSSNTNQTRLARPRRMGNHDDLSDRVGRFNRKRMAIMSDYQPKNYRPSGVEPKAKAKK